MFTVKLNTNRTTCYFPCSSEHDMRILKSALALKFGDLQVTVLQGAVTEAANQPGLTDLDGGNTVKPRRGAVRGGVKKYLDKPRGT